MEPSSLNWEHGSQGTAPFWF